MQVAKETPPEGGSRFFDPVDGDQAAINAGFDLR